MIYVYDGEFDGLLTCIYYHYYSKKADEIFSFSNYREKLFDEVINIETDLEKAKKVKMAINNKLSFQIYKDIYGTFLSCEKNKDTYILKYLTKAFKNKEYVEKSFIEDEIKNVKKTSKRVYFEMHRFLGLIRFSEYSGVLYSKINPDNDILILLGDHFSERLKEEKLVIHDEKRRKAIISSYGKWMIVPFGENCVLEKSKEEAVIEKLWIYYFESIEIETRKNSKLQQRFVPLKYRENLLEFNQYNI